MDAVSGASVLLPLWPEAFPSGHRGPSPRRGGSSLWRGLAGPSMALPLLVSGGGGSLLSPGTDAGTTLAGALARACVVCVCSVSGIYAKAVALPGQLCAVEAQRPAGSGSRP